VENFTGERGPPRAGLPWVLQAGRPVSEDWLEFVAHLSKARSDAQAFAQNLLERTINPPVIVTALSPRTFRQAQDVLGAARLV
jgi:hypothetical protein